MNDTNLLREVECAICAWIQELKKGSPLLIKELETGYAALSKYQYYEGYTIFISKEHANELHMLSSHKTRDKFLHEMATVAEAVYKAVNPVKLNYELLGNTESHMHWHIFPRFVNDPNPKVPVWLVDPSIRQSKDTYPSNEKAEDLKNRILKYL